MCGLIAAVTSTLLNSLHKELSAGLEVGLGLTYAPNGEW